MQAYIPTDETADAYAEQAAFEADIPSILGRLTGEAELLAGAAEMDSNPIADLVPMMGGQQMEVPELEVMSDEDLKAQVVNQLNVSLAGNDSELVGNWRMALQYYLGAASSTPDVSTDDRAGCIGEDGRAGIASMDVTDVIEALMAQIMPTFEGSAIFRFGAVGNSEAELTQDEAAAEAESEAVNYSLMSLNDGYVQLQSMFRDALLMRCGFSKITTRDEVKVESQEYEDLNPADILQLNMDPDTTVGRVGDRYLVRRYVTTRKTYAEAVPQEEIRMSNAWHSPFLDGVPFIAHTRIVRRSELVEMGYDPDEVAEIPTEAVENNEVAVTRSTSANETQYEDAPKGSEPVRYSECYILLDWDGDGIAEQRKVCIGGQDILLDNSPAPEQPFVMSVPILRSHRSTGISMFDRIRAIADGKTESINQHIDNLRWCNQPDIDYVDNQANLGDLLARRPGGLNRVRSLDAVRRNPPLPAGDSALQLNEYFDKMRGERGGVSLDLQTSQMQVAGDTAHGVERQVSSKELTASFLASTMVATGFVPMVKKIHRELRRNPQQLVFKGGSGVVQTDARQWKERETVNVTSAVTLGDQMRRQQALNGIAAAQMGLMEKGEDNVMVNRAGVYQALVDAARVAKLDNAAQYFVDPSSPEAQQAMQQKAQQAQQQAQEQQQQAAQMQQQQAALMMGLESMRAEVAKMREMGRMMTESAKLKQKTNSEAAQLAEDARQANQTTGVDLTKLELDSGTDVPGSSV